MKDDARSSGDRDAAIERLLQRMPGGADPGGPDSCLDAGTLAAWMDGTLTAAERTIAEGHAAGCDRCQAMLAAMVRSEPPPGRPARWWSAGAIRWAVPLVAAAAALALWFAVDPAAVRSPSAPAAPPAVAVATPPPEPAPAAGNLSTAREAPRRQDAPVAAQARGGAAAKVPQSVKDEVASRADRVAAPAAPPASFDKKVEISKPAAESRSEAVSVAAPAPPTAQAAESSVTPRAGFAAGGAAGGALARLIAAPAASTRWRIVSPRRVDRSIDAGTTWTATELPADAQVTAGASPAAGICWLVGRDGLVLRTLDGSTWTRILFPEPLALIAVESSGADAAVVTSESGRSLATSDGGRTWVPRQR